MADGPLVVACLAPADLRPDVDRLSGAVRADARRAELSASDEAALEWALRAADTWRGRVLAVAVGSEAVEPALHLAAALGAAVHRVAVGLDGRDGRAAAAAVGPDRLDPAEVAGDPTAVAAGLAATIERFGPADLVICGDRSPGTGVGAVPALLAHHLGAAQALGLVALAIGPDGITGERRLDGGWRERLRIPRPAVLSIEAAGVRLRRAPLGAALAQAASQVPWSDGPAEPTGAARIRYGAPRTYRPRPHPVAPPVGTSRDRLLALTGALSEREPPRIVGPLDPVEAADELIGYLSRSGYTEGTSK
jgi:electron transfer flavoprotein beta subunit